jgi:hypothetical protein
MLTFNQNIEIENMHRINFRRCGGYFRRSLQSKKVYLFGANVLSPVCKKYKRLRDFLKIRHGDLGGQFRFQPYWFIIKPGLHKAINGLFDVSHKLLNRFCWEILIICMSLFLCFCMHNKLQRTLLVILYTTLRSTLFIFLLMLQLMCFQFCRCSKWAHRI